MRTAVWMLVFCCALWGYSFPAMQLGMDRLRGHVARGAPAAVPDPYEVRELGLRGSFLGWRFGLAAVLTWGCFRAARAGYRRAEVNGGLLLGALFSVGMICQLAGLRYALPSVSSFLTSLTVLFTPFAQALIFRRRVPARTWLGVFFALCGMAVLAIPNPGACASCTLAEHPPFAYAGEILTTLGAMFFTAVLLVLDRYGQHAEPVRMTLVMFVASAALTGIFGALLNGPALYQSRVLVPLAADVPFMAMFAGLTIFSSVLAVYLMYRYQPQVSPAVAGVVYCSESVFATLWSLLFRTEQLTSFTLLGGALILVALAVTTMGSSRFTPPPEVLLT